MSHRSPRARRAWRQGAGAARLRGTEMAEGLHRECQSQGNDCRGGGRLDRPGAIDRRRRRTDRCGRCTRDCRAETRPSSLGLSRTPSDASSSCPSRKLSTRPCTRFSDTRSASLTSRCRGCAAAPSAAVMASLEQVASGSTCAAPSPCRRGSCRRPGSRSRRPGVEPPPERFAGRARPRRFGCRTVP